MMLKNRVEFILSTILLLLVIYTRALPCRKASPPEASAHGNTPALTNDEISYALSDLSQKDLNALDNFIDVYNDYNDDTARGEANVDYNFFTAHVRPRREKIKESTKDEQENSLPNVDEEYLKQLDDSFPNTIDQSSPDDKEKEHVRVKRIHDNHDKSA